MSNLDEYEKAFANVLSEESSRITLLYQLSSISSELNHERLFVSIRDAVTKGAERNYPISFSYFLVLIGINDYKGGEYWPAVWNILSQPINPSRQANWGNIFVGLLKEYKLPEFEDERSHRYVTPILGHGGIPNYCLPDFFEKLLLPIINGEIGAVSTSTEEILQEWKLHSSLYIAADKPVYRFLLHGGKVANDFLSRCIQMAQDIIDGNDLDESLEHLQIPERVIDKFKEWYTHSKDRVKETSVQIKPPKIVFDEIEIKVKCLIPEQSLSEDCTSPTYELYIDDKPATSQKVKSYRYSNKTVIDETEFILPPASKYSIRLINNNFQIRQWEFIGLREKSLWMAFFNDRDRSIIKKEMLPRSSLWLVYDNLLKVKETISIIEEPVFLAGQWQGFKYVRINTESLKGLSLLNHAGEQTLLPLSSTKEPYLDKESLQGLDLDGYPLFTEILPSIHIPFDKSEDLQQWIVTIKTIRQRQNIKEVFRLSDICYDVKQADAVINLTDTFIGEIPIGIFNLRLRGKLGNDKEFTFGFIKQFYYANEEQDFFLADESPTILIETIQDISLNSTECCRVLNNSEVSVAKGVSTASLEVLYKDDKYLLSFDIPRLMWKVNGLGDSDYLGWHSDEFEIPIDVLQLNEDISLTIRANLNDGERCSLQIKESDHKGEKFFRMGRVKFDLTTFTDSISGAGLPIVSLLLTFNNPRYLGANRCILKVRTEWTIMSDSFMYGEYINDFTNGRSLWITWDEKKSVKNRVMHLWDCTRPWLQAKEYTIEDGKTELFIEDTDDLLLGYYRAKFTIINEWVVEEEEKSWPREGDFNVFRIDLSGDYTGQVDDFESSLFKVLSFHDTNKLKLPEKIDDIKKLYCLLQFLYHEGDLDFCSYLWKDVETGDFQMHLKDELCNFSSQFENLLPFKRGEIVKWLTKRKNVRFDGFADGFIKLSDDKLSYSVRLSVFKELEVAPPDSRLGYWRGRRHGAA